MLSLVHGVARSFGSSWTSIALLAVLTAVVPALLAHQGYRGVIQRRTYLFGDERRSGEEVSGWVAVGVGVLYWATALWLGPFLLAVLLAMLGMW